MHVLEALLRLRQAACHPGLLDKSYGVYDGTLNRLNEPVNYEIKDGQWLGVEVKSQGEGGKVIVCAHR